MSTDARLSVLEQALAELAGAQVQTSKNLDRLSAEMREFKDEMREFKGEMRVFKDEMRVFKDEMGLFKDEMRLFKDEMVSFKDEMASFKAYVLEDIAESRAGREADRRKWGELANSMGTLVEDIVAPGIPEVFRRFFGVTEVAGQLINPKVPPSRASGPSREFDAVAWGGGYFLLNETKRRVKPEDISSLVALLPEVRNYFPAAEGLKLVGSVASFRADESVVRAAEREGLLVFGLGTGLLEVLNSSGFKPREF